MGEADLPEVCAQRASVRGRARARVKVKVKVRLTCQKSVRSERQTSPPGRTHSAHCRSHAPASTRPGACLVRFRVS